MAIPKLKIPGESTTKPSFASPQIQTAADVGMSQKVAGIAPPLNNSQTSGNPKQPPTRGGPPKEPRPVPLRGWGPPGYPHEPRPYFPGVPQTPQQEAEVGQPTPSNPNAPGFAPTTVPGPPPAAAPTPAPTTGGGIPGLGGPAPTGGGTPPAPATPGVGGVLGGLGGTPTVPAASGAPPGVPNTSAMPPAATTTSAAPAAAAPAPAAVPAPGATPEPVLPPPKALEGKNAAENDYIQAQNDTARKLYEAAMAYNGGPNSELEANRRAAVENKRGATNARGGAGTIESSLFQGDLGRIGTRLATANSASYLKYQKAMSDANEALIKARIAYERAGEVERREIAEAKERREATDAMVKASQPQATPAGPGPAPMSVAPDPLPTPDAYGWVHTPTGSYRVGGKRK